MQRIFTWLIGVGVLVAGIGLAHSQEVPATTDDWIKAIDRALAREPEKLSPGVLFFPTTGADGKVRNDGMALSDMAAYAATYTPRRRIAYSPTMGTHLFLVAGCSSPGDILDQKTIELCSKYLGLKMYVLPRVESGGAGASKLTIDFRGFGDIASKVFTHEVRDSELPRVPGLIARSVLEHLGAQLTPEEWKVVTQPQVQTAGNLVDLSDWLRGRGPLATSEERTHAFLELNPTCVSAWNRYLQVRKQPDEALTRFNNVRPRPPCQRLRIIAAYSLCKVNRANEALTMLLELAPWHHTDVPFYKALIHCAESMEDERLVRHLHSQWRKVDLGHVAQTARGELLVDWAWEARGDGWAGTVTEDGWKKFRERLAEAQTDLEDAVKQYPDAWLAHAKLETVATGLSLPRAYLEKHFKEAVRVRPRYYQAYWAKMQYLMPRWHGSPEELLAFGKECIATGFWNEGIPQLQLTALTDSGTDTSTGATIYRRFEDPQLWSMLSNYYHQAQRHGDAEDRRNALHYYARWGAAGKHYEEVVVAFQKLGRSEYLDLDKFPEYQFLGEVVHVHTGKLGQHWYSSRRDRSLGAARLALGAGDLLSAEQHLAHVAEPNIHSPTIANYQHAIRLGRILQREKRYTLTPQELKDCTAAVGWHVKGDQLVASFRNRDAMNFALPLGIKHGVITGTVEWTGPIGWLQIQGHTDALRDPVSLVFYPKENQLRLTRGRTWVETGKYKLGPQRFRLEYGAEKDRFSANDVAFDAAVYEDVPSGFGVKVYCEDPTRPVAPGELATVSIKDLTIERID